MSSLARILTVALGSSLAGCALLTDPAQDAPRAEPVALPEQFGTSEAAAAEETSAELELWWRHFESEPLVALVEESLVHNRQLGAAAQRVYRAAAQARIDGALDIPQVSAGFNGSRGRTNFIGFPFDGAPAVLSNTVNNLGVSLNVSWEIDLWGRLAALENAAQADLAASAQDLRAAAESVAAQTAKAWFGLIEAQQQLALAEATVKSRETALTSARNRFEAGLISSVDLRLAESDTAATKALVELRRQALDAAKRQLETLLGRYPAGALEAADELPALSSLPAVAAPAELLSRRPDLAALEARLRASDARLASAEASLYPSLSLTGSTGTSSNELGDLVDGDFRVWNIGGNLLQPLFTGGQLRAQVDLADAAARETAETFADAVLRACAEVELSLYAESLLAAREAHLRTAALAAQAAEEQSFERYRNGLEALVTLLTAQRSTLQAQSELITAQRVRLDNRVDLYLALGGGLPAGSAETAEAPTDVLAELDSDAR